MTFSSWECQDFSKGSDNIRGCPKTFCSEEFRLTQTQERDPISSDFPY